MLKSIRAFHVHHPPPPLCHRSLTPLTAVVRSSGTQIFSGWHGLQKVTVSMQMWQRGQGQECTDVYIRLNVEINYTLDAALHPCVPIFNAYSSQAAVCIRLCMWHHIQFNIVMYWCPCFSSQEFSFPQVWCSNQQPLHCAFSLERYSPATAQLSCKISVRQVKGHEQILQVYTAVAEVRLCSCGRRGWSTLHFLAQPLCNLPGVCRPTAGPALLSLLCVFIESGGHSFFLSLHSNAKHRQHRSSCSAGLLYIIFNLCASRDARVPANSLLHIHMH